MRHSKSSGIRHWAPALLAIVLFLPLSGCVPVGPNDPRLVAAMHLSPTERMLALQRIALATKVSPAVLAAAYLQLQATLREQEMRRADNNYPHHIHPALY